MTARPRVRLHQGKPPEASSMPTCGLCQKQFLPDETYASVPTASRLREVRHNTDACLRYERGPADVLVVGALVHTHRYMLTDWGGRIPAVIVERTEEFNHLGWRAYMLAPEDPSDTSEIASFRNHREECFRKMAETLVIDPEPRKVFISDTEWIHYILPDSTPEG